MLGSLVNLPTFVSLCVSFFSLQIFDRPSCPFTSLFVLPVHTLPRYDITAAMTTTMNMLGVLMVDRFEQGNLKDLIRTSATQILEKGGVVRGFDNWGDRPLPHRIKRHQEYFNEGQ